MGKCKKCHTYIKYHSFYVWEFHNTFHKVSTTSCDCGVKGDSYELEGEYVDDSLEVKDDYTIPQEWKRKKRILVDEQGYPNFESRG
jgi:hypothetical protein